MFLYYSKQYPLTILLQRLNIEQRYLLHDDKNEGDDNADYDDEDDINNLFSGSQTKAFTALQISAFLATAFIKEMLLPTAKGPTCW